MSNSMVRPTAVLLLLALTPAPAAAQARSDDRATIDACLQAAKDNPGRCIGAVFRPCSETRDGGTTVGMGECAIRETEAWSERIDASLASLVAGPLGQTDAQPHNRPNENRRDAPVKGTDIIGEMQRTWVLWRAKKCDTLAMQAEGGSLQRILYGICTFDKTARQALWLQSLVNDTPPR